MQKRGQITIAIILVVFILIVLSVVIYVNSMLQERRTETAAHKAVSSPIDAIPINSYVNSCLRQVAEHGLVVVGQHGGYIGADGNARYGEDGAENYTSYNGTSIPYYVISFDDNYILPLENVTEKLRRYIAVEVENCLEFSAFLERNYNISKPEINFSAIDFNFSRARVNYSEFIVNVTVLLTDEDVNLELQYPMLVRRREAETSLVYFQDKVLLPLKTIYQNVTNLIQEIAANPPVYNLSEHCHEYSAGTEVYFLNNTVIRFITNTSNFGSFVYQVAIKDTGYRGECKKCSKMGGQCCQGAQYCHGGELHSATDCETCCIGGMCHS